MTGVALETKSNSLREERLLAFLPSTALVLVSVSLFAFLLIRFPFDGLSGQDSYAYYYQARELWAGLWGLRAPQWPFLGEGLFHWPVGYHLHIMAGFLFGSQSETGGRLITLAMAALVPLLVASLVGLVWHQAGKLPGTIAGLVAGVVLLLTGVYNRAGMSLMADVPAIFWTTLGMYCLLRAWPPFENANTNTRAKFWWALACGASLGMAVLLRYVSFLLFVPATLYLIAWYWKRRNVISNGEKRLVVIVPLIAIVGAVCALVPQLIYMLSQGVSSSSVTESVVWSFGNLFQTTLSGPDGTQIFTHSMVGFYFIDPFLEVSLGFLSPLYLPALIIGIAALVRQRNLGIVALLVSWWVVPALFFSGSLYQAHRFIITFLPPLAVFIGIGAAECLNALAKFRSEPPGAMRTMRGLAGMAVTLTLAAGLVQSARASYNLAWAMASSKNQELAIVNAAKTAANNIGDGVASETKAVDFGLSAALYHYTGWPILDIYSHDEGEMSVFLPGSGPRLAIIPETSMATQWAGTPSGNRWEWLRSHYKLTALGGAGDYRVYAIGLP